MTHMRKRSAILSSGDFRSEESEAEYEKEKPTHVTSSALIDTKKLLEHQELITAIMIAIKPRLFQFYFQRYTKEMIKNYFNQILFEDEI